MGLNTLGLTFLLGLLVYFGAQTRKQEKQSIPGLPSLLVPQSTGKERSIVSKTHDASMYTERARRSAIMANHSCGSGYNKPIYETNITSGFTNGAVEAYMLTSICSIKKIPEVSVEDIYDGGYPAMDDRLLEVIYDGGYPGMDDPLLEVYYDGGTPSTPNVNVFDGIDPLSTVMNIIYSHLNAINNLDGGTVNTNLY